MAIISPADCGTPTPSPTPDASASPTPTPTPNAMLELNAAVVVIPVISVHCLILLIWTFVWAWIKINRFRRKQKDTSPAPPPGTDSGGGGSGGDVEKAMSGPSVYDARHSGGGSSNQAPLYSNNPGPPGLRNWYIADNYPRHHNNNNAVFGHPFPTATTTTVDPGWPTQVADAQAWDYPTWNALQNALRDRERAEEARWRVYAMKMAELEEWEMAIQESERRQAEGEKKGEERKKRTYKDKAKEAMRRNQRKGGGSADGQKEDDDDDDYDDDEYTVPGYYANNNPQPRSAGVSDEARRNNAASPNIDTGVGPRVAVKTEATDKGHRAGDIGDGGAGGTGGIGIPFGVGTAPGAGPVQPPCPVPEIVITKPRDESLAVPEETNRGLIGRITSNIF